MGLLPDYSRQAQHYDTTRSASPSVLGPLCAALLGAPGRRLADVGGGTGNYALALKGRGWDPVVVDRSPHMLSRAVAKGLLTVQADAVHLPVGDAQFGAVTMVSMLHHVGNQAAALAEAKRILRPGGHLALVGFTGYDVDSLWVLYYFPCSRPWMKANHPSRSALLEELPGAELVDFQFHDLEDSSLAALSADPERVVDAGEHAATSFFERMQRDHPAELSAGLKRLRADIAAGSAPRRAGIGTVLSWTKP
jgi:SAM-dependent methyltransferase